MGILNIAPAERAGAHLLIQLYGPPRSGKTYTALRIARGMVGRWGMSDRIGPVSVLPKEGDPHMAGVSDAMLGVVDGEVRRIIDDCYAEARKLLRDNRDKLDSIVAELLAHETLDEAEVYAAAGIPREAVAQP